MQLLLDGDQAGEQPETGSGSPGRSGRRPPVPPHLQPGTSTSALRPPRHLRAPVPTRTPRGPRRIPRRAVEDAHRDSTASRVRDRPRLPPPIVDRAHAQAQALARYAAVASRSADRLESSIGHAGPGTCCCGSPERQTEGEVEPSAAHVRYHEPAVVSVAGRGRSLASAPMLWPAGRKPRSCGSWATERTPRPSAFEPASARSLAADLLAGGPPRAQSSARSRCTAGDAEMLVAPSKQFRYGVPDRCEPHLHAVQPGV